MAMNERINDMRNTFAETLLIIGEKYPEMLFLDADLHTSTKAVKFKKRWPERFYQFGIAEQNLFGAAAGLALEGFIPFPSTFASFAARRALDQLTISICYPELNVKIPGAYTGIPTSRAGASHNCIEDIAVMRAVPNLKIADPGSARDLSSVMLTSMETKGPVYFRISRIAVREFLPSDYKFCWGKGIVLKAGTDVSLFGTGIMTGYCLDAASKLKKNGISAEVVHLPSIKPIDSELILDSVRKTGCAVTVENASIIGGFGDAVLAEAAAEYPVPIKKIGVRDRFVESGGIDELFRLHGMGTEDIMEAAAGVSGFTKKGKR